MSLRLPTRLFHSITRHFFPFIHFAPFRTLDKVERKNKVEFHVTHETRMPEIMRVQMKTTFLVQITKKDKMASDENQTDNGHIEVGQKHESYDQDYNGTPPS